MPGARFTMTKAQLLALLREGVDIGVEGDVSLLQKLLCRRGQAGSEFRDRDSVQGPHLWFFGCGLNCVLEVSTFVSSSPMRWTRTRLVEPVTPGGSRR